MMIGIYPLVVHATYSASFKLLILVISQHCDDVGAHDGKNLMVQR